MSIYDLKPAFQGLLRPACGRLARIGVTANRVTVAALAGSVAVGAALAAFPASRWAAALVPVWLFLRMALNAIDGMLAREYGMKSDLGAVLNELGDVVSDAVLYLPFALVPGLSPPVVVVLVLLALLTEMAGVVAVQIGASRRYDGPMGKSDRAFVFGLLGFLIAVGIPTDRWANGALVLVALLCAATVVHRARKALAESTNRDPGRD